jgi:phage shock protein A
MKEETMDAHDVDAVKKQVDELTKRVTGQGEQLAAMEGRIAELEKKLSGSIGGHDYGSERGKVIDGGSDW